MVATGILASGLLSLTATQALAACNPSDIGTAGNDTITCDAANPPTLTLVDGLGGDDTITLDGITAPTVTVRGDTGMDTINLINGAEVTVIQGEDDVDTINLINGTVGFVDWGAGNESVTLDLTNVTVGVVQMGNGDDTVVHNAGTAGSIYLGTGLAGSSIGADSFTLSGGDVTGRVVGDNGIDTIVFNSGSVGNEVRGMGGNDIITLDDSAPGDTVTIATIDAGDGVDTINLVSGTVTDVNWSAGNETVTLNLPAAVNVTNIRMGTGTDDFTFTGGSIAGSVFTGTTYNNGSDTDTFTLNGGTITGRIEGDQGADTINLVSGSVGNEVRTGDGIDIITLDDSGSPGTVSVTNAIRGDGGVDQINLVSGTVRIVDWGAGDETYTLNLTNVTVTDIYMGTGEDRFTHTAGTVGNDVYLGSSNNVDTAGNTFTLDGGTINRRIWGGNFADIIHLNTGTIGSIVYGNSGTDTINLVGNANIGGIDGGADVDLINLDSGTVGNVSWGGGDETYTIDLTNVTMTGTLTMGAGMDEFIHSAGHIGGGVNLGIGANNGTDPDTFTLAGGTVGGTIDGDRGVDTINLNEGTVGGQIRSWNGADVITLDDSLSPGTVTVNTINSGADADTINLVSGTVNGNVDWGSGDENTNEILDLTNVTLTGSLIFGHGSDEFTLRAGTVGQYVYLGVGANNGTDADTFTMNGGTINIRIDGDLGADTLNLNGGEILGAGSVQTWAGDDVINLDGTILHGGIRAGDGSDTINLNSGGVTFVDAGPGDDSGVLDLTGVTVGNTTTPGITSLTMGHGADNFTLNSGVINGSVNLGVSANTGTDADIFTMNGGTITTRIEGDRGNDTINLNGGTVQNTAQAFRGFAGNDTVNLNGAMLVGNIDTGDDDDIFNWTDGTMGPQFIGNRGNDAANISSATYDGTTILDGGQFNTFNQVTGDNGTPLDPTDDPFIVVTDNFTDTLTFNGASANVNANTIRGWEVVNSVNSVLDFDTLMLNGVNAVNNNNVATALNVTGGDVTLSGASVLTNLLGSANDEILTVTADTVVSGGVWGAGGSDTIEIFGNASVTGTVFGGAAGHDSSAAADTGDTITLNTTGSVGAIDGGLGDDVIDLIAGTVNTNVLGGAGDDTVTIFDTFTAVTGMLDGGANTGVGDTFAVDTAAGRTFDGAQVTNFENLQKDNTGTLTLTGAHTFSGMATINDGTLDVAAGGTLRTPTIMMMAGTTFNVNGMVDGDGIGGETAITGTTGVETITVAAGATLNATGNLGDGADVLDVIGTLDTGTGILSLGAGSDTFTIHDGTEVTGTVDGGVGNDTFNTNINGVASIGAAIGFETLDKTGTGTLNITGPVASSFNTVNVNAGTVDVSGPMGINGVGTATVASGATLNVDGPITFTAGADTFTVAGNVTGTATIDMLGGNDTFTFQEGANISAVVDGGAGTDTLNADILTSGNLAQAVNFETLTKTGAGTLNITGPGTSDFDTVNVNEGTLDVAATATVSGVSAATVASGATIDLAGSFGFTAGADTFDVSGMLTGAGTFDMLAGNDTLTLRDGADLSGLTNAIDGGDPATSPGDTVVVDNAGALTFDGSQVTNFETLQKDNTGTLTLTGTQSFTGGTVLNGGELDVAAGGTLTTPTLMMAGGTTLDVNGAVNNGAGQTAITGSAGVETIMVAMGGTLSATGDLGDGADVLNVAGTLDTGAGTLTLGAGDDTFTINDGTVVTGIVDGGAGTDTFNTNINGTASVGAVTGFEVLDKTGAGTLNITGPAASMFDTVNVTAGTIDVSGSITGIGAATVASGATLNVDGPITFTAGADTFTVAGTVTGTATIDMLDGNDTFTVQDGANISAVVNGGAGTDTLNTNITTSAGLASVTNFETLTKTGAGTLNITGPGTSDFDTVNVNEGTLDVAATATISDVNAATVASGATIDLAGSFGFTAGNDTFDVSGMLTGAGTFDMLAGQDTLTLRDGADLSGLTNAIDGGDPATSPGDTVVVDNAGALTFDGSDIVNFETLQKDNTGTLTLTGTQSFTGGTVLNGGELDVAAGGTLTTPTLMMAGGTTLDVNGAVNNGAGQTAITGSAGVETIMVAMGGTLSATGDLGGGADVLNVAGTLDTGAGTLSLGAGDDTFTINDGTVVTGTVDGGAGTDTFNTNITTTASLGAATGFEVLDKTGAGTLNITGPAGSMFDTVNVTAGTLNVAAAGSIANVGAATVSGGATLNLDGSFGFTPGNDTFNVAGILTGAGTFDMMAGQDTLTLSGAFDLSGFTGMIDGGDPAASPGDTVIVDTTANATFDSAQIVNFEALQKDNTGTLTLTGTQSFVGGTTLNGGELDVAAGGTLTTPTLMMADGTTFDVNGTVNDGAGQTAITGSAGVETINVAAGGTLNATGDLGDGADVLDVAGTLDTGAGTFFLGAGDDTFIVHDTTVVIGALDAGLGNDTLNVNVSASNLVPLGATTGFESLAKSGLGGLQINGPSSFIDVDIQAGLLQITATGSVAAQNTVIAAGASLQLDGAYMGTAGADTFDVAGTVSGGGGVDLGAGDDVLTLRDGADLSGLTNPIDGGAHGTGDTVVIDTVAGQTFDGSKVVNFETLQKDNTGTLIITNTATFSGGTTLNGGTLDVGAGSSLGTPTLDMTDGTIFDVNGTADNGTGGQMVIAGSAGANTIMVATGGALSATGDLGDGADILNVAGTLDTGGGTLALGLGDDTLTINDGAMIAGIVDGGVGTDTLNTDINTMASLGAVTGFETLDKTGTGTLNIAGPGASNFDTVNVNEGTLDIAAAGSITDVGAATVASGATLNLAGMFGFTPGDDTFTVAGTITGANTVDMLAGDDTLTLRGTADISGFTGTFDGGGHGTGDTLTIDGWSGTLPGTRVLNWETVAVDNGANVNFGPSLTVGTGAGMGLIVGSGSTASGDTAFALTGDLTVAMGGLFTNHGGGSGNVTISGDVTNNGTISMQDGTVGDTMAAGGNYSGTGTLAVDVDFAAATADTLTISGDVVSGGTMIFVADVSSGAAGGDDILLVDVGGGTVDGDFQLDGGTIDAGSLTYGLNLVGSQWFLQPLLLPQNLIYEAYPRNLQALNTMQSHRQRVQNRIWLAGGDVPGEDAGFWLRGGFGLSDFDPGSSTTEQDFGTSDIDYDIDTRRFEAGLDLRLGEYGGGRLVGGVRAFQGTASLSGSSPIVDGNIDTDAIGVGASLTWYDSSDFYIDFQLQYARFKSDLTTTTSALTSGNGGTGHAASVEVGKTFSLIEGWSVTPEAQYVHYGVGFDRFTAASGETVYLEDGTTSELRLGGTLEYETAASETGNSRFFLTANVFRQLDSRTAVNSASDTLVSETRPWRGEVGVGGSYEWRNRNGMRSAVYGDVVAGSDFGSTLASGGKLNGRVGFKMEF